MHSSSSVPEDVPEVVAGEAGLSVKGSVFWQGICKDDSDWKMQKFLGEKAEGQESYKKD